MKKIALIISILMPLMSISQEDIMLRKTYGEIISHFDEKEGWTLDSSTTKNLTFANEYGDYRGFFFENGKCVMQRRALSARKYSKKVAIKNILLLEPKVYFMNKEGIMLIKGVRGPFHCCNVLNYDDKVIVVDRWDCMEKVDKSSRE